MLLAFIGLLSLGLIVSVAWSVLLTWPTMLLFGAVHSFLPVVPAFGFWQTLGVVLLIKLLFGGNSVGLGKS